MGEEVKTLEDLAEVIEVAAAPPPEEADVELPEPVKDAQGRAYATGKRKDAVARVWIKPGRGEIKVNGRDVKTYFARPVLRMLIDQPFVAASRQEQFDVMCTVRGGGLSGQAGAVRHGISRAWCTSSPNSGRPSRRGASSPATPAWWSERNTASARPGAPSSSPNVNE